MAKRRLMLTFPEELLREPVIYNLGQQFSIVINIYRADISESKGWIIIDIDGEEKEIEDAMAWATSKGVRIDSFAGEVIDG